jgi:Family of unknown function (DUF6326)
LNALSVLLNIKYKSNTMHLNNNPTKDFEDFKINVKLKLSALWASVMFCYVYGDYFSFHVPKQIEMFLNGETLLNHPMKLLAAAILMATPALMIFLSLVLKPKWNRWLNIIFGVIYTAIMLLIAIKSIAPWWTFYVFFAILESIITSMIVCYALKWPIKMNQ